MVIGSNLREKAEGITVFCFRNENTMLTCEGKGRGMEGEDKNTE